MIDELATRNAGYEPFGPYGVVVGATIGECRTTWLTWAS